MVGDLARVDDGSTTGTCGSSGGPASRYDGSPAHVRVLPGDRVQRQPQTDRRSAGREDQPAAPEPPGGARPPGLAGGERQHPAGRLGDVGVELGHQLPAPGRRRRRGVRRAAADVLGQRGERVLVGRRAAARAGRPRTWVTRRASASVLRRAAGSAAASSHGSANSSGSLPERDAVGAPLERDVPARQRLAGVPLALAAVHDAARGVRRAEPLGEVVASARLPGPSASVFHSALVMSSTRDEGRLAAHGQPDVALLEPRVDRLAERVDRGPTARRCRAG